MAEQAKLLEWSDPPPIVRKNKRRSKYQDIIDELMSKPGKKAKVMTNVNTASTKVFRDAGLKVETRQTGDGRRVDVWAVYLGQAVKPKAQVKKGAAKRSPAAERIKARPKAKKAASK